MPHHSDWDVQKAVYARLVADSGVTAQLPAGAASICDGAPQDRVFPYIAFGEMIGRPFETAEGGGRDIVLTLRIFSRYAGMKEVRQIMNAVSAALHGADVSIAGHHLIFCTEIAAETAIDDDGETRLGTLRFRIVTEPLGI